MSYNRAPALFVAAVLVIFGGCVYTEEVARLPSGELRCSETGQCPVGSHCAYDDYCWKDGTDPLCDDRQHNGRETAVDCGGPLCPGCETGLGCVEGNDCASGVCHPDAGTCVKNRCDDGVKNGSETDLDCGRYCPRRCALGSTCRYDSDCAPPMMCVQGGCR